MDPNIALSYFRQSVRNARLAKTESDKIRWMAEAIESMEDLDARLCSGGNLPGAWNAALPAHQPRSPLDETKTVSVYLV